MCHIYRYLFIHILRLTTIYSNLSQEDLTQMLQDQVNTLSGGGADVTPFIQASTASPTAMTEAIKKDDGKKVTLIDNRGIRKPHKFTGKDTESFLR